MLTPKDLLVFYSPQRVAFSAIFGNEDVLEHDLLNCGGENEGSLSLKDPIQNDVCIRETWKNVLVRYYLSFDCSLEASLHVLCL